MSYPYRQPDFLESISRGLQVRSMIENIRAQREARAQQAELHRLAIQQHQQQNAENNFKTTMFLQDNGFIPAAPSDTGQNDATLAAAADIPPEGRRPLVETGLGRFRAPSILDKRKRAEEQQTIANSAAYGKAFATAKGTAAGQEETLVPMDFGEAGKFNIPRSQVVTALKVQQDLQGDKFQTHSFQTDNEGNTTFVGIPKGGGAPVKISLGGIGKGKEISEASQNAAAKLRAKNRVKQEYSGSHISQMTSDYAKGLYQTYAQEDGIDWKVERAAVGDASALDEVDMTQAEAARKVNAARSKAQSEAQRIVKDDLEKLEAQYTDEELAKGTQPKASTKAATAAAGLKVGDVKTVRGKQMKITKVYPDGSFDAQ